MAYTIESPGLRRTTIYTTPDDRTRLRELMRQMTLADLESSRPYTASEAIRIAIEYMLSGAFGMGEGEEEG
jgi:hypothetical protein